MSRTGRRRFRALTGTGRAHPKPASTNASGPERVDVRERIEREPPREARRRIPETLGHPAVRDLVNGDGHQKSWNHQDQELQGPERIPQETVDHSSLLRPVRRGASGQRERGARDPEAPRRASAPRSISRHLGEQKGRAGLPVHAHGSVARRAAQAGRALAGVVDHGVIVATAPARRARAAGHRAHAEAAGRRTGGSAILFAGLRPTCRASSRFRRSLDECDALFVRAPPCGAPAGAVPARDVARAALGARSAPRTDFGARPCGGGAPRGGRRGQPPHARRRARSSSWA